MQLGPRIRLGGSVGHALGQVQKVLPSAGASLGGPGGYLVGSLVGSKASGKGWTGNLKSDAIKGAVIAGLGAGAGALAGAGGGAAAAGGAADAAGTAAGGGALGASATPLVTHGALYNAGAGALNWASDHPNAVSGALNAFGNHGTTQSENRYRNDQSDALEAQTRMTEQDRQRAEARRAALAQQFSGMTALNAASANPYR